MMSVMCGIEIRPFQGRNIYLYLRRDSPDAIKFIAFSEEK